MGFLRFVSVRRVSFSFAVASAAVRVADALAQPKGSVWERFAGIVRARDPGTAAFTVAASALLSGVEASVGSGRYSLWMLWSALCLLAFRWALGYDGCGPTFLVFAPFPTFMRAHQPNVWLLLRTRAALPDTALYAVAVAQYVFFSARAMLLDFACCLLANAALSAALAVCAV